MGIFKDNGINNSVEYNMVLRISTTGRRWTNNIGYSQRTIQLHVVVWVLGLEVGAFGLPLHSSKCLIMLLPWKKKTLKIQHSLYDSVGLFLRQKQILVWILWGKLGPNENHTHTIWDTTKVVHCPLMMKILLSLK